MSEALVSRADLIAMVTRAHGDASIAYKDASEAGRALAAQSQLPKLVAENLGAGLGQWDFFPEITEIVDFALAYQQPADEEALWTLARAWAADDAAAKHTVLALIGREILQNELRRIDVPQLKELVNETRAVRERALRSSLGLAVAEIGAPAAADGPAKAKAKAAPRAPAVKREIPTKMPKPERRSIPKAPPPPPPRRFQHPKFGEGVLQSQAGTGEDTKLTIKFASGSKTLLARYVTELPEPT